MDAVLAPRVTALVTLLPAAVTGAPAAVHQARVASRRLREVLPAFAAGRHLRRARKAVRRVTRALGPVRELDVALGHFDAAVVAHPVRSAAQAAMRRSLRVARAAALHEVRATLTAASLETLQDRLDALRDVTTRVAPEAVAQAVASRLDRAARRLRTALDRLTLVYDPVRLHDVRVAVKRLRYALEASGALRGSRQVPARLRQLRQIQDLLGRAHDLHVLAGLLGREQERVVGRSRAAARDLGALASALDVECRALHAAFVTRREGLVSLTAALTARPAGPATESAA